MKRSRLEKAVVRLVAAAGAAHDVVLGGLAVALNGYVRATDDILFNGPLPDVQERLASKGIATKLFRGDPLEGDSPCLTRPPSPFFIRRSSRSRSASRRRTVWRAADCRMKPAEEPFDTTRSIRWN